MTRVFFIGLLFLLKVMPAWAQHSATVSVNVILNPVQVINVNPNQQTVNIEYKSVSDYENGVEVVQQEHILVFSTSPYEVNVSMPDGFANAPENLSEMSFPTIEIAATARNDVGETSQSFIELSSIGKRLISNTHPQQSTLLDVVYKGRGNNVMVDAINQYGEKVVFSSRIVYTIVPK